MPARAFEARATENDPDPITFTVAGREFRCVPMAPVAALDIVTDLPPSPVEGSPSFHRDVTSWCTRIALFVRACLHPVQRDEWDTMTREEYIDPNVYADLLIWLTSVYRGRIGDPDTAKASGMPVEGDSGPSEDELDPITARQYEIDAAAGIRHEIAPDLPPDLQAIADAGGGFTLPT